MTTCVRLTMIYFGTITIEINIYVDGGLMYSVVFK